jgi:hypothetical protein
MRRLEAASAEVEPLGVAECGLAALTRVRLAALISPGRGDAALAAAVERGAPAGTEVVAEARAPRRLATPELEFAGRALPAAVAPVPRRVPAGSAAGTTTGGPAGPAPVPAAFAPRRRAAPAGAGSTRRTSAAAAESGRPSPPRRFRVAERPAGLEWVAPRLAGGAEAAETPVLHGAPDAASPVRWAGRPAAQRRELPLPPPTPRIAPTVDVERVPEADVSRPRPVPSTTDPRARAPEARHGLEALVRAWDGPGGSAQPAAAENATGVLPLDVGDTARSTSTAAPGVRRPRDRTPEREDETLPFSDALGRVLVAELRRYGIEVDAG